MKMGMERCGNDLTGRTEVLSKSWLTATSSITNLTWIDLGSNHARCDERPKTNLLRHGRASRFLKTNLKFI